MIKIKEFHLCQLQFRITVTNKTVLNEENIYFHKPKYKIFVFILWNALHCTMVEFFVHLCKYHALICYSVALTGCYIFKVWIICDKIIINILICKVTLISCNYDLFS